MKLMITETADERPGADVDDGFATTEPELALYAGEAAEREQAASIRPAQVVRSSTPRDQGVQCQNRSRTHGVDR